MKIIALPAFCLALVLTAAVPASALGPPTSLSVSEGFENPLGFYDAKPSFSWQLPDDEGVKAQTAYRVVAASEASMLPNDADLWDSGRIASDQSTFLPYAGKPLTSRQRVHWQVMFWDDQDRPSTWSATAHFELGLLETADWQAEWIKLDAGQAPFVPQYLRREFTLNEAPKTARIYITAKGLYDLHLNGKKVGNDFMTPGWTPYSKRIETVCYDVTRQLRQGENTIAAVLGEGWFAGRLGWSKKKQEKPDPELLVQLEITHADGSRQIIPSDSQWKGTRSGPIRFSGIYDGEDYDARKEIPGWSASGFDDSKWQSVATAKLDPQLRLTPKRHAPVRVTEQRPAVGVNEPAAGRFVFDLGQNIVGWPELRIPVRQGQTITIRFAEMLEKDGTLYTENYRSARSADTYIAASDGTILWHPTFTFHGFRYVELSGFPEEIEPSKDWVTGMVLHSDFDWRGHFESSHDKLNQLQSNITWGLRGNFLEIPTDCPQRDERLGWTGDAQAFAPAAIFNADVHAFFASWLESMRDDQQPGGEIPNVVPNILNNVCGGAGWSDAATVIPWEVYVRTGDPEVLSENYDMMRRWVENRAGVAKGYIVDAATYGDWLQPYPRGEGNRGDTPLAMISTAYFARSADLTARAADVLGKTEQARQHKQLFESIRNAFVDKFFAADGKMLGDTETQTGYLLALGFDLLPESMRQKSAAHLARVVEAAGGHLGTGFLGTPLLAPTLERFGRNDLAFGVLFKETYPSWFYSINQGATTMWERWNSYSHADGFGDAGMNSFNHYAYGAVGQWMVERIAGLAPDPANPGYKHLFIHPTPGGPLESAEAELKTPYGIARSAWTKEGKMLIVEATIPPNTTATFQLPTLGLDKPKITESGAAVDYVQQGDRAQFVYPAGTYRFTIGP